MDVTAAALRVINRVLIDPIHCAMRGMVRRGTWSGGVAGDKHVTGSVRAGAGSTEDDYPGVELFLPHGIVSVPPDGSRGVLFSPGGDVAHRFMLAAGNGAEGSGDMGNGEFRLAIGGANGARITLRNSGDIEIEPGVTGQVKIGNGTVGKPVQMGAGPGPAVARVGDPVAVPSVAGLATAVVGLPEPVDPASVMALMVAIHAWASAFTPANPASSGTITGGGTGSTST